MISIDSDGLLLSRIQGELFEKSSQFVKTSSLIFIRRFMNSKIAYEFDTKEILNDSKSIHSIYNELEDEYGKSEYGKNIFNSEVLYWIGYIYRYFSYTYNLTSKQVFKIVKPNELNEMYYVYHTYDCANAIERILEEKNIDLTEKNKNNRLFEMIRKYHYEDDVLLKKMEDDGYYLHENKDVTYNGKSIDSSKHIITISYHNNVLGNIKFSACKDIFEMIIYSDKYKNNTMYMVLIQKILDYARCVLKKDKLAINVKTDNEKLIKVLENNDFKCVNEFGNYFTFEVEL